MKSNTGLLVFAGIGAAIAFAIYRAREAQAAQEQQLPAYAYRYFRNDVPVAQRTVNPANAVYL